MCGKLRKNGATERKNAKFAAMRQNEVEKILHFSLRVMKEIAQGAATHYAVICRVERRIH